MSSAVAARRPLLQPGCHPLLQPGWDEKCTRRPGKLDEAAACAFEAESSGFAVHPDLRHFLYDSEPDSAADGETLLTAAKQKAPSNRRGVN